MDEQSNFLPQRRFYERLSRDPDPQAQKMWRAMWSAYQAAGMPFGPRREALILWLLCRRKTTTN